MTNPNDNWLYNYIDDRYDKLTDAYITKWWDKVPNESFMEFAYAEREAEQEASQWNSVAKDGSI